MINIEKIKEITGYKPRDITLYENAFTHKSMVKETGVQSNERLEFMGDSVINMIVAEYLYETFPNENEGFLTKIRTKIVCSKGLSTLASKLNLHEYIQMNDKAMSHNWNTNQRILEDTFESLFGALYLDRGIECCKKFMIKLINKHYDNECLVIDTNYKEILMKFAQKRNMPMPEYIITHENGPDHNKMFTVQIKINNKKISEGSDKSKKNAEQNAANLALNCLGYTKFNV